jgi:hypothetical protein
MNFNVIRVFGMTLLSAMVLATPASAGCKEGFCVNGHDNRNRHSVDFTSTYSNVDHYNVRSPWLIANGGGHQFEVGRNERGFSFGSLPTSRPLDIEYSIQACSRGGFPPHSNCGPWVTFYHTMR